MVKLIFSIAGGSLNANGMLPLAPAIVGGKLTLSVSQRSKIFLAPLRSRSHVHLHDWFGHLKIFQVLRGYNFRYYKSVSF